MAEYACEGAHFDFGVHWYNATLGLAPQDDMAPALPQPHEPKAFQSANNLGSGNPGKFRHELAPAQ